MAQLVYHFGGPGMFWERKIRIPNTSVTGIYDKCAPATRNLGFELTLKDFGSSMRHNITTAHRSWTNLFST